MDFFETVRVRRSVKLYEKREVEREKLEKMLETAAAAPSAANLQGYEMIVVTDAETKRALAKTTLDQDFISDAPVVIVFFQNTARSAAAFPPSRARVLALQDATIACAYAQLAATAQGLATCWVGGLVKETFSDDVRELLDAPRGWEAVAMLTVGYPTEVPPAKPRRPLGSLVTWHQKD